jgi:hypothetical protein
MKLLYFLIFLLSLVVIYSSGNIDKYNKIENFSNLGEGGLNQYPNKDIFTPIKMIKLSDITERNELEYVFTSDELENLIDLFPVKSPKFEYKELPNFEYNYFEKPNYIILNKDSLKEKINKLFNKLKDYLEKATIDKFKICNDGLPCKLILLKYTILRVGNSVNSNNKIYEGQLLTKFKDREYCYLIDFVISDEDDTDVTLHNLNLTGYDLETSIYENLNKYNGFLKEPSYLNLDTNNVFNKYRGNKNDYTTPNKRGILMTDNEIQKLLEKRELDKKKDYKCYGKDANNKLECETLYDRDGIKLNSVGVWDYPCLTDKECPYFMANKNYPNTFGKCVNGSCELPLGVTGISPHNYLNADKAICYNCMNNNTINCCNEQMNNVKFKSPDYKFKNDEEERKKYNEVLKSQNLEIV